MTISKRARPERATNSFLHTPSISAYCLASCARGGAGQYVCCACVVKRFLHCIPQAPRPARSFEELPPGGQLLPDLRLVEHSVPGWRNGTARLRALPVHSPGVGNEPPFFLVLGSILAGIEASGIWGLDLREVRGWGWTGRLAIVPSSTSRWTFRSRHGENRGEPQTASTERPLNMKRAARLPTGPRTSQGARPCRPTKILPTIRRKDLPVVHLPRQTRSQGGKTKLTNHRAAIILRAISCGCYRETAAELASIKAETLSHWMGWSGEPYETFQRLVRKAEAGLESRMVMILTGQAEVRPELALAILERKFPRRWAKVTVVAAPPHHLTFNVADILLGTPLGEIHSGDPASAWANLVSRRGFRVTNPCHMVALRPEEVSRGR